MIARFRPSSMSRVLACPYSVRLTETITETFSGDAASAGTILHSEFERVMSGGKLVMSPATLSSLTDIGYSQMWAHKILADSITGARNLITKYKIANYFLEKQVKSGSLIDVPDFWGTADFIGIDNQYSNLLVADLKTGSYIVHPENNAQLMSYALGAFAELSPSKQATIKTVTLSIIQPRNTKGVVSTWQTDISGLNAFGIYAKTQIQKVDQEGLLPTPSLSTCRRCPGRFICPDETNNENFSLSA